MGGIFCDAAMQAAHADRSTQIQDRLEDDAMLIQHITQFFRESDTDHSGTVTEEEFQSVLENDEARARFQTLGVTAQEATGLIRLLDVDNTGEVDLQEFITGCLRISGGAKGVDMVMLLHENKKLHKEIAY